MFWRTTAGIRMGPVSKMSFLRSRFEKPSSISFPKDRINFIIAIGHLGMITLFLDPYHSRCT